MLGKWEPEDKESECIDSFFFLEVNCCEALGRSNKLSVPQFFSDDGYWMF